jgi:uncharacterized protein
MDYNPVGWFEIYVKDMDRARKFYEGMLGVTLENLPGPGDEVAMYTFPMNPEGKGSSGALAKMAGDEQPSGNGVVIYFSCEDCSVEAGRAVESGGSLVKEKFSIGPYGFVAIVKDTEGNVIGLHSQK